MAPSPRSPGAMQKNSGQGRGRPKESTGGGLGFLKVGERKGRGQEEAAAAELLS